MKIGRNKSDNSDVPQNVKEKRFARKMREKNKNQYKKNASNDAGLDLSPPKGKILDALYPQRHSFYIPRQKCSHISAEIDLENFSFLENPEGTMMMLRQIIHNNSCAGNNRVNFRDFICHDMAPYMVLNLMENEWDSKRIEGGAISHFVSEVLKETDFVEHLNIRQEERKSTGIVWPLKLMSCKQSGPEAFKDYSGTHGTVADKFTSEIEKWLEEAGFGLSDEGIAYIMQMISEVLNNAMIHSNPEMSSMAWLSGFMVKYAEIKGIPQYACHISILNMGDSIYESMQTCSDKTRQDIEKLTAKHRSRFTVRNYWNEEALWTLYALQDGVSRIHGEGNPKGGKGLMDMIEFFSHIGPSSESKLVIISGNVILNLFNPKPEQDGNGMRRLALNESNDLEMPPDRHCIKLMKKPFPGTILTWRFFLNPSYLEKVSGQ